MKKIFFCDMDGTLALPQDSVDIVNLEDIGMIKKFQVLDQQNEFVLATGRAYNNIAQFCQTYDLTCQYIISENGACIWHNDELVHYQKMNKDTALKLLERLLKTQMHVMYSDGRQQIFQDEHNHTLKDSTIVRFADDLYQEALKEEHIIKVTAYLPKDIENYDVRKGDFKALEEELINSFGDELEIMDTSTIHADVFDIQVKLVSKGHAVQWLLSNVEIDEHKTYAAGDAINDYHMFEVVDKGFKMRWGNEKLKEVMFGEIDGVHQAVEFAIND